MNLAVKVFNTSKHKSYIMRKTLHHGEIDDILVTYKICVRAISFAFIPRTSISARRRC